MHKNTPDVNFFSVLWVIGMHCHFILFNRHISQASKDIQANAICPIFVCFYFYFCSCGHFFVHILSTLVSFWHFYFSIQSLHMFVVLLRLSNNKLTDWLNESYFLVCTIKLDRQSQLFVLRNVVFSISWLFRTYDVNLKTMKVSK